MGLKSHRRSHETAARLSLPHLAPLGQSRGLGGRDRKKDRKSQQKNMKRIPRLIFPTLAFGLVVGVGAPAHAADKKPNIVMLMQDDTGWNDFGCYSGGGVAVAPPSMNIVRLVAGGARLTYW